MRHTIPRAVALIGAAAIAVLAIAAPASAHVSVSATNATQGGYSKVTFRVPTEDASASTIKLEVNIPVDAPVTSVSTKPVPGWSVTVLKTKLPTPIKAGDREITEAVTKVTWAATSGGIRPGEFQEFDVSMGPLPAVDRIVFKALQTYSNGTVVRWIEEPAAGAEPEHPAPVLRLAKAAGGDEHGAPAGDAQGDATNGAGGSGSAGIVWGVAGVGLGVLGVIVGLLAYRKATVTTR